MDSSRLQQVHQAIARLQRLAELFQKRREQLARAVGLTDHQWGVLEEISTEHFMPSMFARRRESSPAAVSKTIRQLVDKELVEVSVSVRDARQRTYELTDKGKQILKRLRQRREDAIERVWMKLEPKQVNEFARFADEISPRLEELLD